MTKNKNDHISERVQNSEMRQDLFLKLAAPKMDRRSVDNEIKNSRKHYQKALTEYNDASSQLAALQKRVDKSQGDMNAARDRMVTFNNVAQTMDLIGATEAKPEKDGDYSYIVDGDRMYADTSDFSAIRLVPWKERMTDSSDARVFEDDAPEKTFVEKLEDAVEDPLSELSYDDEDDYDWMRSASVENAIITKVAKKFR